MKTKDKKIRTLLNDMKVGLNHWTEFSLNSVVVRYNLGASLGKVLIEEGVLLKSDKKTNRVYSYKWNPAKEYNEELVALVVKKYEERNKMLVDKRKEKDKAQEELFSRVEEEKKSDPTPIIEHPKARIKEEVLQQGLKSIKPDAKKEINILWGAIKINW